MRKIIFLIHVTLDGFVADKNGGIDWAIYNEEVQQDAHALHATTDTAIYGRETYEMMHGYWPTVLDNPESGESELRHARWYDAATKVVFSKTLDLKDRERTIVISDNIKEEITKLKQADGKDIWLLGSPSVAQTLMALNLIDEYRLNVNPVILGSGKPLFGTLDSKLNLELIEAKTLKGGVVSLRYKPID